MNSSFIWVYIILAPILHLFAYEQYVFLITRLVLCLDIFQMAYELHGLLAGNVSIVTGDNIKLSYGGDDESFLQKVITPGPCTE